MKIYVAGEDKGACIALANELNGKGATALIAPEGEGESSAPGKLGSGFDRIVLLSEDPTAAAINANRNPKVRAAVCYNQKSLKAASTDGINVFIIDPDALDKLDLSPISSSSSQAEPRPNTTNSKASPSPAPIRPVEKATGNVAKRQPPPPRNKQQEKEDDADEMVLPPAHGLKGRIRDLFGIEG